MSLLSRVLFTVLACAAVPLITALHAAQESGKQWFSRPYQRFGPLSRPERLTRMSSETARLDRDAPSVPHLQPHLLRKGHLVYNPSSQRKQAHSEQMSHVPRGQYWSGAKPASHQSDLQPLRRNHDPFLQTHSRNGGPVFAAPHNPPSWQLPIVRKSSQQERLFPQAFEQIPRRGALTQPESRSVDKINWQSPGNPPASRSGGYWRSQTNTQGHDKDTKVGAGSVRASKFPSFSNQKSFIAPSVRIVTTPETLTSSKTHLSHGFPSNANEKTSFKRVQSSLLWHSHSSEAPKGVNAPNLLYNPYKSQDFDQQMRSNLKSGSKGNFPTSVIFRPPKKNPMTSFEDSDSARNVQTDTNKSGQLKEIFRVPSWPGLQKNSPSVNSRKENFDSSIYRLVRPSRLQKYSFEQRIATSPFGRSFPGFLDTTTPKSQTPDVVTRETEENISDKPITKSKDVSEAITPTIAMVNPQTQNLENTKEKDEISEYKAVIYDDIIGSASFSSVTPAETSQNDGRFVKSATPTAAQAETEAVDKSVDSSQTNATGNSAEGETFDLRQGEADTELGKSDRSASQIESEAKSVPDGPPSDLKDRIESDSLLELDYLRTSTGNVSFQSLSLNL